MPTFELVPCRLRPWREQDLDALTRYANDREVWINLRERFPHPYTEADAQRWLEYSCGEPAAVQWAIEVGGEAVGGIGLEPQGDIERISAEIGFWLGRPFWGRGLMTRAVGAVSDWALNQPECVRLYASVLEWNPASMRVLEKAGYQREARLRRSAIKDGSVVDRVLYARIRERAEEPESVNLEPQRSQRPQR